MWRFSQRPHASTPPTPERRKINHKGTKTRRSPAMRGNMFRYNTRFPREWDSRDWRTATNNSSSFVRIRAHSWFPSFFGLRGTLHGRDHRDTTTFPRRPIHFQADALKLLRTSLSCFSISGVSSFFEARFWRSSGAVASTYARNWVWNSWTRLTGTLSK